MILARTAPARTALTLLLALTVAAAGCFGGGSGAAGGEDGAGVAADDGQGDHDPGSHDHGDHGHVPAGMHTVPPTDSQGPKADGHPGGAGNGTQAGGEDGGAGASASPSPEPSDTPSPGPTDPDDPGPTPKRDAVTWVVTIRGGAFENATLTIQLHDTVRWVHDDGTAHTVTADDAEFDSGYVHEDPMVRGQVYEKEFDVTGYYPYHCSLHPGMTGSVFVRERWDATPPA